MEKRVANGNQNESKNYFKHSVVRRGSEGLMQEMEYSLQKLMHKRMQHPSQYSLNIYINKTKVVYFLFRGNVTPHKIKK